MRAPTLALVLASLLVARHAAADEEASDSKAMEAAAADAAGPLRAVSDGAGSFSTSFFKQISTGFAGKNLISSPLSAHIVLSMAAYGAAGNTRKQMQDSLYLPAKDEVGRQGFSNLIDQLNNVPNVTLEVANKMYLAQDLKISKEFKQLSTDSFRSEASSLDVTQPKESAELVNNWVKERTHDKIKDILKEDDITAATRMVLLNAVYFKGKWAKAFKADNTQERTFHLDEKTEKKVPTMFVSGDFFYGELSDLKAKFIELPYENENIKMVIIVPDEVNGLADVVANLEKFNRTRLSSSGYTREVQLYLPKFKIESTIDLKEPLMKLGMEDMFGDSANFSGIAKEPLKVGKVLQKAFIEVNEEGSEAAAVTGIQITLDSFIPPADMIVDRPFLYLILDRSNGVVLFEGHVLDPVL